MKEAAVRSFEISRNQYQAFRFNVDRPSTLYVNMAASAPVDVLIVDSQGKSEYENGYEPHAFRWGRRVFIEEETVRVDPGTWYIIVEGRDNSSSGRLRVLQQ